MAKTEAPKTATPPLLDLTKELREHLEGMGPEFDKAAEFMDAMDEIGVDQTRLRAQLDQAKKMRDVILRVFPKP